MDRLRTLLTWLRKIPPERYLLLALLLLAGALWWWAAVLLPRPLAVTAFAVGKGDAFLIRAPGGRTVLIDGGSSDIPNVGPQLLVPNLMLEHVRRLDAIMLTHPDSDHINGLPAVMEAMPVGMLLDPELPQTEGTEYQQVLETATRRQIPHYRLRAGMTVDLGAGATLRILAPGETLMSGTVSDTNNNCVVCLLAYRQSTMLFTGDLETPGEQSLLANQPDLHADILKVAHHGSRNGTTDAFLDAVHPSIALISCPGGTQSSHPHAETLARLRAHHVQILRTDVSGQIRLSTYGHGWQTTTFRPAASTR